jgi:hypothetical protein
MMARGIDQACFVIADDFNRNNPMKACEKARSSFSQSFSSS